MAQSENIVSPVGRFIYGSLTDKRTTDMDRRPIPADKQQFEIGVAFLKSDPAVMEMWQKIASHAYAEFANQPAIQQQIGAYNLDGFSWKISDGDKPNRQGQVNENSKGHFVFYFKSSFAINCADGNNQNAAMPAENIKRGYFVRLSFTCAGNGEVGDRAGVYLNPQYVQFVAYGEEIVGGISAEEAFAGAAPAQLPPGASQVPIASGAMPAAAQPAPAMPSVGGPAPSNAQNVGVPGPATNWPATGAPPAMPAQQPPAAAPQQPGFPQQPPLASGSTTASHGNVQPHPTFADGPGAVAMPGQLPPR